MLKLLRSFLESRPEPEVIPSVPDGQRVYAIGDIHGRYDLLCQMIAQIEADEASRPPADTTVILLGDLVDRGPDSASVIATAREWAKRRRVRILAGNHEEMFLGSFERDDTLRHFLRHGGRETLLSYPIEPDVYSRATLEELRAIMHEAVPADDIEFMRGMEDRIQIGDYVFVHAGVRPGIPLEDQKVSDLRWIRGEFIEGPESRNFAVVHGHTILETPHVSPLRISLDTGAYASGLLTAVGLEGTARWLISVQGEPAAEAA
ncbi:metallophosphoesterase [Novosphingobium sediminis]|uniref:Metallophosphoesterase n=1 Tax=Novosphingobium sediminis TaxID=707214 RepID=A0A512AM75_9SPHN|nr:metallophosphoesterase [Novosphingobium sediminis]